MRLKKVGTIQKYSGKEEQPDDIKDINSKENVEKIEDTKEEVNQIPPIMQIDYDELPDGVYDFAGLAELQHRKTRPNPRENEKLLKSKNKKGKRELEKKEKIQKKAKRKNTIIEEKQKNIVEELFEEKKNNVEKRIEDNFVVEEKVKTEKIESEVEKKEEEVIKPKEETSEVLKVEAEQEIKKETNEKIEPEEQKIPESEEKKKENLKNLEKQVKIVDQESKNEEYEDEDGLISQIVNWCTTNKIFAFMVMIFLGVITQISYLAISRENNLKGLLAITLSAISLLLLVNVLKINNKILIFLISLIAVLLPAYNDIFITGENAIMCSIAILLAILSLNLVFVKNNKIICFVLAIVMFAIGYKIYENCVGIFLVISIIKIIEDIFNKTEKIFSFLIHCLMICIILATEIFL